MTSKNNSLLAAILFATIASLFVVNANAQDAGALQRELRTQVERSVPPPQIERVKPVEIKEKNPDEQKIFVKGFKFSGNTFASNAQLQELVVGWENSEITFGDLKDVTTAIQDFYGKQGRLALANVPPQEVKDGIVLIEIHEGKLGSVIVEPANPEDSLRISTETAKLYFVTKSDGTQYIETKPLQRGLTLLNELPGVFASAAFEPGKNPEESNFRVKLSDGPLFNGQAAISNYGSASTGVGQAIASLSLNNPSGFGDQAKLDVIESQGSSYGVLGYSLPVGHDGWRAGIQGSYLTYRTLSSYSAIQTQGTANTVGINATYALMRDQSNTMNLRFGLDDRNYSNNQYDLNISKYQITALTAGLNGDFADTVTSLITYGLTATFGHLNINNLTQAGQDLSGPGTAGSYQKLSFNATRYQELSFIPNTTWLLSAYGQLANKNLNSSEQIYMGGPFGVRAYPVAQGGGSQGAIASTELQYRIDDKWQVGAFVDAGVVQQYVKTYPGWQGLTNAGNTYNLTSTGLTGKYAYDNWLVNATLAFRVGQNPLYNSSGQQVNVDNAYHSVQGWIRASYTF